MSRLRAVRLRYLNGRFFGTRRGHAAIWYLRQWNCCRGFSLVGGIGSDRKRSRATVATLNGGNGGRVEKERVRRRMRADWIREAPTAAVAESPPLSAPINAGSEKYSPVPTSPRVTLDGSVQFTLRLMSTKDQHRVKHQIWETSPECGLFSNYGTYIATMVLLYSNSLQKWTSFESG
jgi:hypothetical protein